MPYPQPYHRMLPVIFSNLEFHFRSHEDIDEQYFIHFQDDMIKEMYDNMLNYTHNTAIICNIIFQMLKRDLGNVNLIWAALGAIEYQTTKLGINPKLFSITEKCVEKNKDVLMQSMCEDDMRTLQLMAYFGHLLPSSEHEPIYSFKVL